MPDNIPSEIPQTPPVQPKKFNITRMVERRELASFVFQICDGMAETASLERKYQYLNLSSLFQGILTGYDDWFKELGVNEAVFKMVAKTVDYEALKAKAADIVEANIPSSLVVVPDARTMKAVAAAKEIFDTKIRRG
jgi:hypothetical protein